MKEKKAWGRPLGSKQSAEAKKKIGAARKGQKHREDVKKRISRNIHLAYLRRKREMASSRKKINNE